MNALCFLLDEHVPLAIQERLVLIEPRIRVYTIGDDDVPSKGTSDADLLRWIEERGCMLVTNNRSTIPVHLRAHINLGRHIPGIVQLPKRMHIGTILADLLLIWEASLPGEFQDQIVYLPLRH